MDRRLETEMMQFLYDAFESARQRRAARVQHEAHWTWAELVRGVRARFEIVLRGERQQQDRC